MRGRLVTRGKAKRADIVLYYKPNLPIALIEAKDNTHSVGDGMQQGLDYAAGEAFAPAEGLNITAAPNLGRRLSSMAKPL
ncbi:MAG: hypothetical protein ABR970_19360 [Roseiarcus sp.]